MKRIFTIALVLVTVLVIFAGCGADEGEIFSGFSRGGHVSVSSGGVSIQTIGYLTWASIDEGGSDRTETVFDRYNAIDLVSGKTDFPVAEIPRLVLDGEVKYSIPANGSVKNVHLITQNGSEYTQSETTFEALSGLADGTYYVVTEVLLGGNCDPDLPQNSYRYETVFCLVVGDVPELKMYTYTWDGWGISGKTIVDCEPKNEVIYALQNMKETGETVPKISDDEFRLGGGQYPAERGTMWIEYDGKIYRLTPDMTQICLVRTHFGEGKVLEMSDEFKSYVNDAYRYAPYDYYRGTYNQGDKTVELENVFKSGSSIQMKVKKVDVEAEYDPENSITFELTSSVDQEVRIKLDCRQSDDNLAQGDAKFIRLEKGVPTSIELTFGGWPNFSYWVYVEVGFTKAEIKINPSVES